MNERMMQYNVSDFLQGIVHCQVIENEFFFDYLSEGTAEMFGYSKSEFDEMMQNELSQMIHKHDFEHVMSEIKKSFEDKEDINLCFRLKNKGENWKWCHFSGKSDETGIHGILTNMPPEFQLFRHIAQETADGIYVIEKNSHEILYENESKKFSDLKEKNSRKNIGRKCYEVFRKTTEPCSLCAINEDQCYPKQTIYEEQGRHYSTYFKDYDWDGKSALVKYMRDVTDDVLVQKEKERLEQYFQTILKYLPGGIAVVCHKKNGEIVPEFLSDGFAEMVNMSPEQVWELYQKDALAGVHPEDRERLGSQLNRCIAEKQEHYEIVYRLMKGKEAYIWVKATFTLILSEGGDTRVYVDYHDITDERENAIMMRQQYQEQLLQHYLIKDSNVMVLGHCNITANQITEIDDYTDSELLETFGDVREEFFRGISTMIVDPQQRLDFLKSFLNMASLESFNRGETEIQRRYFIQLPKEKQGRYALFKVNLVETPDTGDITGILTVTDITNQIVRDQILHQISVNSCDLIADVDLFNDTYVLMNCENQEEAQGKHSNRLATLIVNQVLPREREYVSKMMSVEYMIERLSREGSYTLSYSIEDETGEIRAKKLVATAIDLRIGRVCLARTDITDSVREQRGLLKMIAYTFELACFIELDTNILIMYTRETVLKNLSPHTIYNYNNKIKELSKQFRGDFDSEDSVVKFSVKSLLKELESSPDGFDFVIPYQEGEEIRYKQVNVLWGDENRKTICLVRADITDVIETERQSKEALEEALALAKKASMAKSEFLSSMSHDIRTPMNAIMGMTTLGLANLGDQEKVENYLKKISSSSKHLLSLINDILDMSKIEVGGISLKCTYLSLKELMDQLYSMMEPQAKEAGVDFIYRMENVKNNTCYADSLRINQILINLVGNAIKFTPEGGKVELKVEEIDSKKESGWNRYRFVVKDNGIGMTQEFMDHLFEPFVRSKNVSKVEGTGLGLSITKGLVDLMDGTIRVESQIGEGTIFVVELEFETSIHETKENNQENEDIQNNMDLLKGYHFLVAEDNALNSEILCELLRMYGATTLVKEDGLQAIKEFEQTKPQTYDAILMDIQMPIMNGFEATKAIRTLPREDATSIPIIAMTANAFAEDVKAAIDVGMNEYVAKPVDIEVLCEVLKKVLKI